MEATISHAGQCRGTFCTFLFRGISSGPIELTPIAPRVSATHTAADSLLRSIRGGVLTVSPLTFTGGKSDFVRNARSHGAHKLLAATKCGDRAAFDELFQPVAKRTFQIVYRITRNREDAEDSLQNAFLRAFLHIKAFESRSSFSSWLTSIAINSAPMIRQKKRNSVEIFTDGSGNPDVTDRHWEAVDRAPKPHKHCLQKERERILRRAIRALRPSIRGVVEMQQFNIP